jgi:beta-glucosidase
MARIDDAVRRILKQKARLKLWEHPFPEFAGQLGSPEHRAVAREAVRQSAVLLKNQDAVLPLPKNGQVLVVGSKADDMGIQCGGWTVGWAGRRGNVTPGTTIFRAIQKAALPGKVEFSPGVRGRGVDAADAIVVVVGEEPYAEGTGDSKELGLSRDDIRLITAAKASGKKLVVVLIAGRPLPIEPVIDGVQAVLVVWLPGSEGDGVADVLFGDFKPTGKLSHSWPRSMAQIPINQGDASYAPLFPYGFGLSY